MSYAPSGPAASASGALRSSARATVASAPSSAAGAGPSAFRPTATTRVAPSARAVWTASRPDVPVAPSTGTVLPSAVEAGDERRLHRGAVVPTGRDGPDDDVHRRGEHLRLDASRRRHRFGELVVARRLVGVV